MAIPERFLEELTARNDIVEVVSAYVPLTKRSGNNLFGLCPFHSERTPSFSVNQEKQIYHCFGCGKGGGVINFIMEEENLSFPDAVHFLADRVGMIVPEEDSDKEIAGRRQRILELNKDAARYYFKNLSLPAGQEAVDYIRRRGISPEMVRRFGLGAAPDDWSRLTDEMRKQGYTAEELLSAGLSKRGKNGGLYDTFRNRLVFPVLDVRGSVLAFSGRILSGEDGPKYLNSPDTPVFSKSRCLFALNLAKKSKRGMLILVEGNVDVVSLHQAGFDCAVASLGTSLTPEQARLMTRYTENVVICYDGDAAGKKAAQRAIPILDKAGLKVKVVTVTGAKDPDEFIKSRGADAFSILIERSENHIEYRLEAVRSKYDLETDDGRIGYLQEAARLLASLPGAVEREVYAGRAAEACGVSTDAMKAEVERERRRYTAQAKRKRERDSLRPAVSVQADGRSTRYENVYSAAAEEGVIALILADPALLEECDLQREEFSSDFLGRLYSMLRERYERGESLSVNALSQELDQSEMSRLVTVSDRPPDPGNASRAMADYIKKIRDERLKAQMRSDLRTLGESLRGTKGFTGNGEQ